MHICLSLWTLSFCFHWILQAPYISSPLFWSVLHGPSLDLDSPKEAVWKLGHRVVAAPVAQWGPQSKEEYETFKERTWPWLCLSGASEWTPPAALLSSSVALSEYPRNLKLSLFQFHSLSRTSSPGLWTKSLTHQHVVLKKMLDTCILTFVLSSTWSNSCHSSLSPISVGIREQHQDCFFPDSHSHVISTFFSDRSAWKAKWHPAV